MGEIEKIKKENKILKKKLKSARLWLKRMLSEEIKKIASKKINKTTSKNKNCFLDDNIEEIISKQINDFFGEFILLNTPSGVVGNIISGEINYYNLRRNPNFDGFSVISSYHKAIDKIIETILTKPFRKYCKKIGQDILRKNDSLEKTLHMVVNKGYILSIGRLYHLLLNISQEKELYDYSRSFKDFLNKYDYLKEVFLDKDFLKLFKKIIETEIFGKKRHSGKISFVETRKARKLILGDLKDKNCLIYKLLETQEVAY